MSERASICFLGTRGTISVEGTEFSRYGGATACALLRLGGLNFVLDAGTGLLHLESQLAEHEKELHLMISHPHYDHIIGLPPTPLLYDPSYHFNIYAQSRRGLSPEQQIALLMHPPLWPVGPEAFKANVRYHTLVSDFSIGEVSVRLLNGAHPGGSTVFRFDWRGRSVVYASDYELDEKSRAPLADFAKDCTLLLCDGQYTEEEFEPYRGFGHSTWQAAAALSQDCGAKLLRILHHAPWRTDAQLDAATPDLQRICVGAAFARYREEIIL